MKCTYTQQNRTNLSKHGFSLVEVLLAIVILALIATPIASAFYTSLSTNLKSRKLMAATDFTSSIIEELEKQTLEEIQYNMEHNSIGEEDSPNRIVSVGVTKESHPAVKLEGVNGLDDFIVKCQNLKLNDRCMYYTNFWGEDGKVHTCYFIYQVDFSEYEDDKYAYLYDCLIEVYPNEAMTEGDEYGVYVVDVSTYNSSDKESRLTDRQVQMTGSVFNKY